MNTIETIKSDLFRVSGGGRNSIKHILFDPEFKYVALYRCAHSAIYGNKFKKVIWRVLLKRASIKYGYEIAPECVIGPGLRLVHRGGVCINPAAVLGSLWMPTFLPFFKVPFIWGPLGGADGVPKAYLKELPFKQRVVQSMRYILIKTAPINPLVYFPSKAAVAIIGRTQNNVEAIPQRYRKKCHVILETAMENGNLLNERKSIQEKGCVEIISTGRLVPFKNIRMAIEVLKRIRDDGYSFHYTIVGKGPEKKQIEEMVKNYHLAENIKLVGEVPRETVMEYLKMADMYLFPSLREGGSWALMEAMAAELPVVCFDWTGTGVITDDLCANRIKPTSMKQDVDCFADAVEDLINNPEKRVAYGVHARERILNVYNWDTKGRFMDKLFDDLEGKSHE